ncbi:MULTISPECIES: hypothetical protein [Gordonia]|jgi:hypothetical protein|uniref:hypothetical protein n=1 Tax=Gordonia TaxID=2053 RepID=UPI0032B5922B
MTPATPEDYLDVLRLWSDWTVAQRFPTVGPSRLVEISRDPQGWSTAALTPVEAGWAPTIQHLLDQVALGVRPQIAVAHLPDRLRRAPDVPDDEPPTTPATEPASGAHADSAAADDPLARLTALLFEWRTEQIARGVEGADTIRDVTLRKLAELGWTDAARIQGRLTGPAAGALALEIAQVIAGFKGEASQAPAAAATPPASTTAPPAPPQASTPEWSTPTPPTPEPAPSSRPASTAPPADAASPSVTPAPPPPMAPPPMAPGRTWSHDDFAVYDYPETDVQPGRITVAPVGDAVRLTWDDWPAAAGEMVLYRVVSSDDVAPYKPESGELLDVTTTPSHTDGRFLSSAVRIYQVWVHVGADEASARAAQPIQWAGGEEVSPVDKMRLSEESGRVIGEWEVFPGTRSVRIFRIPLDGGGPPTASPSNQILTDQANLTGFVDAAVPRGKRFLYSVQAEVMVNESARLSRAIKKDILVSVDLVPITDLAVEMAESGSTFNLRWTTPKEGQQVRIHRFPAPPPAGLENEDRDESAITVQGFTEETRIKDPVTALDPETSQITGVLWPPTWERAYLTPVTTFNGRVRIGTTQVQTRPLPAVIEPRIVERFNTELITFGWPVGAAAVQVFVGPKTLPPEQICAQPQSFAEVTASTHRRDGAIILPQALPGNGCTVCLVPVAYSRGEQIRGEIATLDYPGLARVFYWFDAVATPNPMSRVLRLVMRSYTEIANPPALVLVANPQRLPLDSRDGQILQFHHRGQSLPHCDLPRIPHGTHPTEYTVDLGDTYAFIRLFVHEAGEVTPAMAVHDPALTQLMRFQPPLPPGEPV